MSQVTLTLTREEVALVDSAMAKGNYLSPAATVRAAALACANAPNARTGFQAYPNARGERASAWYSVLISIPDQVASVMYALRDTTRASKSVILRAMVRRGLELLAGPQVTP